VGDFCADVPHTYCTEPLNKRQKQNLEQKIQEDPLLSQSLRGPLAVQNPRYGSVRWIYELDLLLSQHGRLMEWSKKGGPFITEHRESSIRRRFDILEHEIGYIHPLIQEILEEQTRINAWLYTFHETIKHYTLDDTKQANLAVEEIDNACRGVNTAKRNILPVKVEEELIELRKKIFQATDNLNQKASTLGSDCYVLLNDEDKRIEVHLDKVGYELVEEEHNGLKCQEGKYFFKEIDGKPCIVTQRFNPAILDFTRAHQHTQLKNY
jgi:hypothetical protein